MKSGVSPQKLRKYRWQTPIWATICTPVAPSPLIFSGHSPRLGGHNFRLGEHDPGMPPRSVGPGATGVQIEAEIGVCDRYFRNFCGLTPDFMIFLG